VKVTSDHAEAKAKRKRHVLRIDHSKMAPDAFKPVENVMVNMAYYVVFDIPPSGYTAAEVMQVYNGFAALYSASSSALISKLIAGES